MTILYAWVHPLSFDKDLDHTWVTDYAPPPIYDSISAVEAAGKNYWYCWGIYHPEGQSPTYPKGAIGNSPGNLPYSLCICDSNDDSAHGTIFVYGIDGVCHQLANQVLFSTVGPLTVKLARGYAISVFFWLTYGLNQMDFLARIVSCRQKTKFMTAPKTPPDDFEEIFTAATGEATDSSKYKDLMEVRTNYQNELQQLRETTAQESDPEAIATAINDLINEQMKRAAEILGAEAYQKIYGVAAGKSVKLVDPDFIKVQNEPTKQA